MTNANKVIAIDGPAGSGKSTLARALASHLGFNYLDTGALYRAAALKLTRCGLSESSDDTAVSSVLQNTTIEYKNAVVYLDGVDVSNEIRTPEAGHFSSVFSARAPVRDYLLEIQRQVGRTGSIVAEGRDMAAVVFPEAWRKFYVTADEKVREQRRFAQLRQKNASITLEDACRDVTARDARDTSRAIAPLIRAEGAVEIDTTNLSEKETIQRMLKECL